ncbi:MAG: hypothetical protein WBG46_14570 [Nonlabens sp.]
MNQISLDMDTAVKMKLHYQEEYMSTLKKLEQLKQVLDQLEGVETNSIAVHLDQAAPAISDTAGKEKVVEAPRKKRKYKKRKGTKNKWQKFIQTRLKATQTPLSYDDMTNHAIAIMNLDASGFDKIRKNIVAAAFQLRAKLGIIDTYAIKGSRTKYMGFKDWFEREGLLKIEFAEKINS